jgi:hypothetical protein
MIRGDLGRRGWLDLPERRYRLLHSRDRRLEPRSALSYRGGAISAVASCLGARDRSRLAHARRGQRKCLHLPRPPHSSTSLGVAHRRDGCRDPESQAFALKLGFETQRAARLAQRVRNPEETRCAIGAYVESCHSRPLSGLNYETPTEIAKT